MDAAISRQGLTDITFFSANNPASVPIKFNRHGHLKVVLRVQRRDYTCDRSHQGGGRRLMGALMSSLRFRVVPAFALFFDVSARFQNEDQSRLRVV